MLKDEKQRRIYFPGSCGLRKSSLLCVEQIQRSVHMNVLVLVHCMWPVTSRYLTANASSAMRAEVKWASLYQSNTRHLSSWILCFFWTPEVQFCLRGLVSSKCRFHRLHQTHHTTFSDPFKMRLNLRLGLSRWFQTCLLDSGLVSPRLKEADQSSFWW